MTAIIWSVVLLCVGIILFIIGIWVDYEVQSPAIPLSILFLFLGIMGLTMICNINSDKEIITYQKVSKVLYSDYKIIVDIDNKVYTDDTVKLMQKAKEDKLFIKKTVFS